MRIQLAAFVAGAGKTGSIHKGLHQANFMTVAILPVTAKMSDAHAENKTGKVFHSDPGQDGQRMLIKLVLLQSTIRFIHVINEPLQSSVGERPMLSLNCQMAVNVAYPDG